MQIFNSIEQWRAARASLPTDATLGFAPTMGNLHAGHASLFKQSSIENDYTATSIFVNPTQFNKKDDFTFYPRTLEADLLLLEQNGVDFCLVPSQEELYADNYNFQIHEHELCTRMEGAHRPGHFNGVLTVVMKLLQLIKPNSAYFGEKDYQQYLLIKNMANAFFMDVAIKSCPTIRETSGLAYSSRNNRLTAAEKSIAQDFAHIFHHYSSCDKISSALQERGITIDYIEEFDNRRFAAVYIGAIRLIDNYAL